MKFLESITSFDNDVLIPIDRIKYIFTGYENGYFLIKIHGDDGNWSECFPEEKSFRYRYNEIKNIINQTKEDDFFRDVNHE